MLRQNLELPIGYAPYVAQLPIDFQEWASMATNTNTSSWNKTELQTWTGHYVEYHNAVIALLTEQGGLGSNSTGGAAGNTTGGSTSGVIVLSTDALVKQDSDNATGILTGVDPAMMNSFIIFHYSIFTPLNETVFATPLDMSQIWNSTLNSTEDMTVILGSLQTQKVLWETYAFFDLFFGDTGLITRNSSNSTPSPSPGGRRFLQESASSTSESSSNGASASSTSSSSSSEYAYTLDQNLFVFGDIHHRIELYATTLIFDAVKSQSGSSGGGTNTNPGSG